jgi:hypothetical protein
MKKTYLVSAKHVSPDYTFDRTPVEVGEHRDGWSASHAKLGYVCDFDTPEAAIRDLFGASACAITKIELNAGYEEAAKAILDGKAIPHALWILVDGEHARDGYALKPNPWEGPGEYQHIEFDGEYGRLVRIPLGVQSLCQLYERQNNPKPPKPPTKADALDEIVREVLFGDGTDASLQAAIDLCNAARDRFGIERLQDKAACEHCGGDGIEPCGISFDAGDGEGEDRPCSVCAA